MDDEDAACDGGGSNEVTEATRNKEVNGSIFHNQRSPKFSGGNVRGLRRILRLRRIDRQDCGGCDS